MYFYKYDENIIASSVCVFMRSTVNAKARLCDVSVVVMVFRLIFDPLRLKLMSFMRIMLWGCQRI